MSGLAAGDVPRLPRGVRMRFDGVRNAHVLLAPERTFDLDPIAVAILELVDGKRTVGAIAATLAERYGADQAQVQADIIGMLDELAAKRMVETVAAA